jgi:Fic family protein
VQPHLVRGTLRVGFELGQSLTDGFARALYAMFLIAEVHPFKDGNGRLARVFLNAELTNARLSRIIIPEVFRDDYVQALKALTNSGNAEPYIRAMSKAQQFTAQVNYETFDACLLDLTRRNAFRDPNEARLWWQA